MNRSDVTTKKTLKLDERDRRELIGMALRFLANNLTPSALFAMGHYGIHDDLTEEEYEALRAETRAALRNLAAEVES